MIKISSQSDAKRLFGLGLYTPREAALYARVQTQLMSRWVHGDKKGSPVLQAQIQDEKVVTFLDFVQTLAIRTILNERPGISPQKIRQAHDVAKDTFGVDYPFALKSTRIGLFGPPDDPKNQNIWLYHGDASEGDAKYYFLSGPARRNELIAEVVLTYTKQLVFDDATELATKYFPFPAGVGGSEGASSQHRVVMDSEVRFGEPYVESCGYTVQSLYDAYQSEGGIRRAAEICGVTPEEITLAIDYMDFLQKKPRAL